MNRYIKIDKTRVSEIILDFTEVFPNTPATARYTKEYLNSCIMVTDDTISIEKGYIYKAVNGTFTPPEPVPEPLPNIEWVKLDKCSEINEQSTAAIYAGVDVNGLHYGLTANDQIDIITLAQQAISGKDVPYHATGEKCRFYTPAEFLRIYAAAMYTVAYNTTYANLLKCEVNAMTDVDTIKAVAYGTTVLNEEDEAMLNSIISSLSE